MKKPFLLLVLALALAFALYPKPRSAVLQMVSVPGAKVIGGPANAFWSFEGAFSARRKLQLASFLIGKFEVTKTQYRLVMEGNPLGLDPDPSFTSSDPAGYPLCDGEVDASRPVEGVTWYDALYFCNLLSVREGYRVAYVINAPRVQDGHIVAADVSLVAKSNGYRLPTEVEWEFAARGGKPKSPVWNYLYAGQDSQARYAAEAPDLDSAADAFAWYQFNTCSGGVTVDGSLLEGAKGWGAHQVGLKRPNSLGLYDMSGNVWEWCWDRYAVIDEDTPAEGASIGDLRCCRGGAWYCAASCGCVARRGGDITDRRSTYIGFRVVRPKK